MLVKGKRIKEDITQEEEVHEETTEYEIDSDEDSEIGAEHMADKGETLVRNILYLFSKKFDNY